MIIRPVFVCGLPGLIFEAKKIHHRPWIYEIGSKMGFGFAAKCPCTLARAQLGEITADFGVASYMPSPRENHAWLMLVTVKNRAEIRNTEMFDLMLR